MHNINISTVGTTWLWGRESLNEDMKRKILRQKLSQDDIHFGNWCKRIFTKYKFKEENKSYDRRVSWSLLAKYISQTDPVFDGHIQEHHVRTIYFHCEPCALKYEMITSLENAEKETKYISKKLKINEITHFGESYSKRQKRINPWTQLRQNIIKESVLY